MNVLFVCTGNTCRSPMAEAFFNEFAAKRGISARASSRGMDATDPAVSDKAFTVMRERGLRVSHTPQRVSVADVNEADLILTMTQGLLRALRSTAGLAQARKKSHCLADCVGDPGGDVPDPDGGTLDDYRTVRDRIERLVTGLVDLLEAKGAA